MAAAPPPRELVDDVIAEILLRLPPDEPECLFRAALVCKPWHRTLADPAFHRRYCAFHGAPPLLGLVDAAIDGKQYHHFVPTTAVPAFPLPVSNCRYLPLDCRHGRVLVHMEMEADADEPRDFLVVWDPATDGRHRMPSLEIEYLADETAVFCAASGCAHIDCHGGPFCVVLMASDGSTISASLYSSEEGAWSTPVALDSASNVDGRGALIGDEIYFSLWRCTGIVKYEWRKNCLSMINAPPLATAEFPVTVALMAMEDSSLGFATTSDSSLHLWLRKKVRSNRAVEWEQFRVIDLETKIPMANPRESAVVGFAEGVDVIFICTSEDLFTIELKSGRVRKVDDHAHYFSILPYMSFYTPGHCRLPLLV